MSGQGWATAQGVYAYVAGQAGTGTLTDTADMLSEAQEKRVNLDWQSDVEPWLDEAACVGHDPKLFEASPVPKSTRQICAGCPVIAQCLRWTMNTVDIHVGFQAGMTGPERETLSERLAA